jgi:hypothetical protein
MPRFNISTDDLYEAHFTLSAQTTQLELLQVGTKTLATRQQSIVKTLDRFSKITELLIENEDYIPTSSASELWLNIGDDMDEFMLMVDGIDWITEEQYDLIIDARDAIEDVIGLLNVQFKRRVKAFVLKC